MEKSFLEYKDKFLKYLFSKLLSAWLIRYRNDPFSIGHLPKPDKKVPFQLPSSSIKIANVLTIKFNCNL